MKSVPRSNTTDVRRGTVIRDYLKDLGKRLREARDAVGLTQDEIAKAVGGSKQLISHWETGRSEITAFDLWTVSKLCGVSMERLIGGTHTSYRQPDALPSGATLLSFATADECLAIARGDLALRDVQHKRVSHSQLSDRAMTLAVPDPAMEPTFNQQMIITVDAAAVPSPGECILVALLAKNELLFRRYIPKIERKGNLRAPFKLKGDNFYFPEREICASDKPVYLGRLVETVVHGNR